MAFLFGGASRDPRRDRELLAGNERTRRAFARDINDERALAFGALPPRRPRRGMWMVAAVAVFMTLGAFGLLPRLGRIPLEVSCTQPGLALASYVVRPGAAVSWRATGPDGVDYVLTLDAAAVTGPAGQPVRVSAGGTALSPPFQMRRCEIDGGQLTAPSDGSAHVVRLFQRRAGGYVEVAQVPLTLRH
ncbi:MAG TPA: hypothetical protein VLJ59_17875 [Mycobacteriales bacterium]|nr:hypothetical protein [Mycobacteriales bacterium]